MYARKPFFLRPRDQKNQYLCKKTNYFEAQGLEKLKFMQENLVGQPFFKATRRINDSHEIEKVGKKLRGMMPWIASGKMVDKNKN